MLLPFKLLGGRGRDGLLHHSSSHARDLHLPRDKMTRHRAITVFKAFVTI